MLNFLQILNKTNYCDSDFYILGIVLNMCVLLAEKHDLAVVKSYTNEETSACLLPTETCCSFLELHVLASILEEVCSAAL